MKRKIVDSKDVAQQMLRELRELDTYGLESEGKSDEGEIMSCELAISCALIQVKNIRKANALTLNNLPAFIEFNKKQISEFWDYVEAAIKRTEIKNGLFIFDDNFDTVEASSASDNKEYEARNSIDKFIEHYG